jgi:hypothetical protein
MSRDLRRASRLRCALVRLAAAAAVSALAWWVLPDLRTGLDALATGRLGDRPFEQVLVWICEAALLATGSWLAVVTLLVAHDAARGSGRARRGVPATLHRLVLGACGAVLVGGLTGPAYAAPSDAGPSTDSSVLTGLPLPDRASAAGHVGRVLARQVATVEQAAARPASSLSGSVVVQPGDTLWGIADAALPADASPGEIAAGWQRIYRANRSVIGPDPDLILPSQRLRLPAPHQAAGPEQREEH